VTRQALLDLLNSVDLSSYSAVEFVPSIAGATTISRDDVLLVEVVLGHVSGILDHALLHTRVLIDRRTRSPIRVQHFSQNRRVDPESLKLLPYHETPLSRTELVTSSLEIAADVEDLGTNMLSELMIARERRTWVDAKPYPWGVDLRGLLRPARKCIYGAVPAEGLVLNGAWRTSEVPAVTTNMSLVVGNRPLTSHFVTYSLERGLAAIMNR